MTEPDHTFDAHGFYAQWPPRYDNPVHYACFMMGVELGMRGRDRNPLAPPSANDPEGTDLAFRHGHAWGLKLRADFGPKT